MSSGLASWLDHRIKRLQANALTGIASSHLSRGCNEEALQASWRAADLFQKSGDKAGLSVALASVGNALLMAGKLPEARDCALRSLAIHSEGRVSALILLGSLSISAGDYSQAIYWYSESLKASLGSKDLLGEGVALGGLARAHRALGNFERSAEYLELRQGLAKSSRGLRL